MPDDPKHGAETRAGRGADPEADPGIDDTTATLRDTPPGRRGRWWRRAGVALLVVIVALAAVDLLGPRSGETSVTSGSRALGVEFPQIARAGEPAPLHVTVDVADGFGEVVQLRICDEIFNDLDFQNWYPNPSAETAAPPWVIYEFDPPPSGDTLEISLDARVAPGQLGETDDCQISLLEQDEPVVSVSFTTWRLP